MEPFAILRPGQAFPAYGSVSEALGPLAVGGDLRTPTLVQAYSQGIFPWYSEPPILWWSPDPRMVLPTAGFKLHKSLRKTIQRARLNPDVEICIDRDFATVLKHCANVPRHGQNGTWINADMQNAYLLFHQAGYVHSVETRVRGELTGGLYFVNIGRAVFGESMFALRTDASKIALCALVALCRKHGIGWIDCQQNTPHLQSLGGMEITRAAFLAQLCEAVSLPAPQWRFSPADWDFLLAS